MPFSGRESHAFQGIEKGALRAHGPTPMTHRPRPPLDAAPTGRIYAGSATGRPGIGWTGPGHVAGCLPASSASVRSGRGRSLDVVGLGLAYLVTGRYADRLAPRPLAAAGLVVASAGTLPYVFATADSNLVLLGVSLFVRGIGFGAASLHASVAVYRTLHPVDIPGATSASNVIQRVGAATGTAVMALVLQANGFTPALTWMFVLTLGALAATVFLPRRKPAPSPRDTVPTTAASESP